MAVDDDLKQGSPSVGRSAGKFRPPRTVLVLNAGSSSLKFALYEGVEGLPLLLKDAVTSLSHHPQLHLSAVGEEFLRRPLGPSAMDIAAAARRTAAPYSYGLSEEVCQLHSRHTTSSRMYFRRKSRGQAYSFVCRRV